MAIHGSRFDVGMDCFAALAKTGCVGFCHCVTLEFADSVIARNEVTWQSMTYREVRDFDVDSWIASLRSQKRAVGLSLFNWGQCKIKYRGVSRDVF